MFPTFRVQDIWCVCMHGRQSLYHCKKLNILRLNCGRRDKKICFERSTYHHQFLDEILAKMPHIELMGDHLVFVFFLYKYIIISFKYSCAASATVDLNGCPHTSTRCCSEQQLSTGVWMHPIDQPPCFLFSA